MDDEVNNDEKKFEIVQGNSKDLNFSEVKDNLTIDRIDSNKDYCPENCRFATYKEQNNHLKTTIIIEWDNKKMTLSQ